MTLREIGVGIDMDIDASPLKRLDDEINQVLQSLGRVETDDIEGITKSADDAYNEVNRLTGGVDSLDNSMKKVDASGVDAVSRGAGRAEKAFGGLKTVVLGVVSAITAATVATGLLAADVENAYARVEAQTGATGVQLEELQDAINGVYTAGYGDSLDEVANATARVKQNMHNIDNGEIEQVTKNAMLLADVFDSDVNEVTRGTNNLMEAFGITSEKAFDLFTKGGQNGLNFSNEMFDNVAEYSSLISNMGFTVEEYFGIMQRGAKVGVYNLDFLNDSMKEFQVLIKDGSKRTGDAMGMLSKDTNKVWQEMLSGKRTVADVATTIVAELKGMDSQVEAGRIAVDLFGTKFEDLESKAIYAMLGVTGEMENFEGSTAAAADAVENTLGEQVEGAVRDVKTLVGELADEFGLIDFGTDAIITLREFIPLLEEVAKETDDVAQSAGNSMTEYFAPAMDLAGDALETFVNGVVVPLMPIFSDAGAKAMGIINPLLDLGIVSWDMLGAAVRFLVEEVVIPSMPLMTAAIELGWAAISPIIDAFIFGFDVIADTVETAFTWLTKFFNYMSNTNAGELLGKISSSAASIVSDAFGFSSGLGRVPYDDMPAILHKDEAIIPAEEAEVLRNSGILQGEGRYPKVDIGAGDEGGGDDNDTYGLNTTVANSTTTKTIHAPVTIIVDGAKEPTETAQDVKEALEGLFADLHIIMEV